VAPETDRKHVTEMELVTDCRHP